MRKTIFIFVLVVLSQAMAYSQVYFPMEVDHNRVEEISSHQWFDIHGCRQQIAVPAAIGNGWRTDGYSTYIEAPIHNLIKNNALSVNMKDSVVSTLTISFWCAIETYPMMTEATMSPTHQLFTDILGNIDDKKHTGFAFQVSNQGHFRFRCYSSGWEITCDGGDYKLWWNEWHHLVATIDGYNQEIHIYDNGNELMRSGCMYDVTIGERPLLIGKSRQDTMSGMFCMNNFNGIIDEVRIDTGIWTLDRIVESTPQHPVDFNVPIEAYADDLFKARYHGMPSQGWTNESHGLTYSNGRYHVFFQKNGNGPYMARLHWGHISSPDLFHWHEDLVALMPDQTYDIKGCWSGCVIQDGEITGGQPWALYSAIGNREAFNPDFPDDGSHCELMFATPKDPDLKYWHKPGTPGIRCAFSDDFRDPYFFRHNGRAYIIAGCATQGLGIATLHRHEGGDRWSSDGDIFFRVGAIADAGSFWEMPTITPMGNEKWVFTCTPMSTSYGVRSLYWVGSINNEGHFIADDETPQTIELPGLAKDGFGLLSPSIFQKDGKTIVLGIVPDKVSTTLNYTLGWAHLYSYPREWYLDEHNNLCQRPYSGLYDFRTQERLERFNFRCGDTIISLSPVEGRSIELCTSFIVDEGKVGFTLLKNNYGGMKVYIDSEQESLVVDMTTIGRKANDIGVFDGVYTSRIPSGLPKGSVCKLDVFFDHSILDIFINDRYASSIRVYPYDYSANGCEAFVEGKNIQIQSLLAYGLGEITHYNPTTDIEWVTTTPFPIQYMEQRFQYHFDEPTVVRVYDTMGRVLFEQTLVHQGSFTIPYTGYCVVTADTSIHHQSKSFIVL